MTDEDWQLAITNCVVAAKERDASFDALVENMLKLYPTREDMERRRCAICFMFLETRKESTILSWVAYQELKKELTGVRLCVKNQTTEECAIMSKGLRIDMWIKNIYKKLRSKCYNKCSIKSAERRAELLYQEILSRAFPESRKRVL